jgi:hypothetical protein
MAPRAELAARRREHARVVFADVDGHAADRSGDLAGPLASRRAARRNDVPSVERSRSHRWTV